MSFREKMHWSAFVGLAGTFGWYFLTYPWAIVSTLPGIDAVAAKLTMAAIIIVVLMVATAAYLAIRYPKDMNFKDDERDRDIHLRGTHAAYYPLVLGVYAILMAAFWKASGAVMLNLVLAVVISAELIRVGWQLWLYRKP